MPKVMFLVPPLFRDSRAAKEAVFFVPNIGLGYVAGYLASKGIDVRVLDAQVEGLDFRRTRKIIKAENPDFLGITAPTSQVHEAALIARQAKQDNPDLKTVLGGWHASALPLQTLDAFPAFDYLVRGEGEISFYELIMACQNKANPLSVLGIGYRSGGARLTPARPVVQNLDLLPFPAWQLFPLGKCRPLFTFLKPGEIEIPVLTARGCPYECVFCSNISGRKVRFRSPENVIAEIKRNINDFGMERIIFTDENFTLDRQRARKICELMISERLNEQVSWIAETRVNLVDPELLGLMAKAGCRNILYGVESGNQFVLDKIRKGIRLEEIRDAFRWTREAGMLTYASFMIGHPFETERSINDTIGLALELDPDYVSFNIAVPFPGTELERMAARGEGGLRLVSRDWKCYGKQIGGAMELEGLDRKKLEGLQFKAYRRFYLRPGKFGNLLRVVRDIRSIYTYAAHKLR